ncbi:hypothetical protein ACOSP7_029458 [Xanthoceras sorbifolium]
MRVPLDWVTDMGVLAMYLQTWVACDGTVGVSGKTMAELGIKCKKFCFKGSVRLLGPPLSRNHRNLEL